MTPGTDQPVTARAVLLGAGQGEDLAVLRGELRRRSVARRATVALGRLTRAADESVLDEVAVALAGLLEVDLAELLVAGWRKLDALGAAARRTLGPPVGTEVVDLATSRMSWVSEPHVDLVLDGMRVATLDAVVTVTFEITGLAVTVRGGALVGLAGGSGTASVSLAVEGQELLPSRSVQIAPAWLVPLTPPIRLAEHDPASTVVLPRARPADATIAP